MVYDLSPGDVIQFGDGVTLTVLAVEVDLIHFGVESRESDCPYAAPDCQDDGPTHGICRTNGRQALGPSTR
jgi:hypothetical protein